MSLLHAFNSKLAAPIRAMASVAALISSGASKASLRILSRASTSFSTIETTGMSLLTTLDCTRCNSIFADLVSGFSIRWLTFRACESSFVLVRAVFWRVLTILYRTKTSSRKLFSQWAMDNLGRICSFTAGAFFWSSLRSLSMLHSRSIFQQARQTRQNYRRFGTRKVSSICEGLFRKFLSQKNWGSFFWQQTNSVSWQTCKAMYGIRQFLTGRFHPPNFRAFLFLAKHINLFRSIKYSQVIIWNVEICPLRIKVQLFVSRSCKFNFLLPLNWQHSYDVARSLKSQVLQGMNLLLMSAPAFGEQFSEQVKKKTVISVVQINNRSFKKNLDWPLFSL